MHDPRVLGAAVLLLRHLQPRYSTVQCTRAIRMLGNLQLGIVIVLGERRRGGGERGPAPEGNHGQHGQCPQLPAGWQQPCTVSTKAKPLGEQAACTHASSSLAAQLKNTARQSQLPPACPLPPTLPPAAVRATAAAPPPGRTQLAQQWSTGSRTRCHCRPAEEGKEERAHVHGRVGGGYEAVLCSPGSHWWGSAQVAEAKWCIRCKQRRAAHASTGFICRALGSPRNPCDWQCGTAALLLAGLLAVRPCRRAWLQVKQLQGTPLAYPQHAQRATFMQAALYSCSAIPPMHASV